MRFVGSGVAVASGVREDLFRFDGSDGGTTGTVFAWIFYVFPVWGLVLLVIGVRTMHGWTWARSIAGVAWAAAIGAGLAVALTLLTTR